MSFDSGMQRRIRFGGESARNGENGGSLVTGVVGWLPPLPTPPRHTDSDVKENLDKTEKGRHEKNRQFIFGGVVYESYEEFANMSSPGPGLKSQRNVLQPAPSNDVGVHDKDANEEDDGDEDTSVDSDNVKAEDDRDEDSDDEDEEDEDPPTWTLDGVVYHSYQEYCQAKRLRNERRLDQMVLQPWRDVQERNVVPPAKAKPKEKRVKQPISPNKQRKSSRLRGVTAAETGTEASGDQVPLAVAKASSRRVLDGAPLPLSEALEHSTYNWIDDEDDNTIDLGCTMKFVRTVLKGRSAETLAQSKPLHRHSFSSAIEALDASNLSLVRNVCPTLISSVAMHPLQSPLVVAAGDDAGHVGLWNVPDLSVARTPSANDTSGSLHLFRPHEDVITSLQWTRQSGCLLSSSKDGTVRWFDVQAETFHEIFAALSNDSLFRSNKLLPQKSFFAQYACLDNRSEECFFLSTSAGTAMHLDLRHKPRVTFHKKLLVSVQPTRSLRYVTAACIASQLIWPHWHGSEPSSCLCISFLSLGIKSLHPDGYSFISAAVHEVALWDLRKLGDDTKKTCKVASYNCGHSVVSAFFSSSGRYVVSTTLAHKLDFFENFHTQANQPLPFASIPHKNKYNCAVQAISHPGLDLFAVGSSRGPPCINVFDPAVVVDATGSCTSCMYGVSGDALAAVASRVAFHPRSDALILAGGDIHGHVTIVK